MYIKVHDKNNQRIVAACDRELIGKILDDGKYYIDLDSFSGFYKGEECTKEKLFEELKNFTSANLVGKKAVSVAIENNLVKEEDVITINGFPFIQIYKI